MKTQISLSSLSSKLFPCSLFRHTFFSSEPVPFLNWTPNALFLTSSRWHRQTKSSIRSFISSSGGTSGGKSFHVSGLFLALTEQTLIIILKTWLPTGARLAITSIPPAIYPRVPLPLTSHRILAIMTYPSGPSATIVCATHQLILVHVWIRSCPIRLIIIITPFLWSLYTTKCQKLNALFGSQADAMKWNSEQWSVRIQIM